MCDLESVEMFQSFENLVNDRRSFGVGERSVLLIDVRPKVPTCDQILDYVSNVV
jgi:hypothetical protein